MNLQPHLFCSSLILRPLVEADFSALFQAASDPLIWEQHPDRERYKKERFELYFRSGIDSGGAFVILKNDEIIGSSRYTELNPTKSSLEIGYSFLTREHWGKHFNLELKTLMLDYAFENIGTAYFVVGANNFRSQAAMIKIGAVKIDHFDSIHIKADPKTSVVFEIKKAQWQLQKRDLLFHQPTLESPRFILESITEVHSQEIHQLYSNPELHLYVPFEPGSLEEQRQRCIRWSKRRSPSQNELWLNWAAREKVSQQIISHFQVSIDRRAQVSIGYLVAKEFHRQNYASEGLCEVFKYLKSQLGVHEVKLWSDTRNIASHALATKLGFKKIEHIQNADFFKGASSDEFVFLKHL